MNRHQFTTQNSKRSSRPRTVFGENDLPQHVKENAVFSTSIRGKYCMKRPVIKQDATASVRGLIYSPSLSHLLLLGPKKLWHVKLKITLNKLKLSQ
jgi:hypothetical protein